MHVVFDTKDHEPDRRKVAGPRTCVHCGFRYGTNRSRNSTGVCPDCAEKRRIAPRSRPASCAGCDAELPLKTGRGNYRKWCTEKCRVMTHYKGSGVVPDGVCERCGGVFKRASRRRRFCMDRCWKDARNERCRTVKCTARACVQCGKVFTPKANNNARAVCCSQDCAGKTGKIRRRNIEKAAIEVIDRVEVFERDWWMCSLCGGNIDSSLSYNDPMAPVVDHELPIALGGRHEMGNLRAAHRVCNERKGARVAA